jgi:hypothetical protein
MLLAAQILSLTLHLILWGMLAAFGIWLYRRLPLRSLPWAGAYLLLTTLPLAFLNSLIVRGLFGVPTVPFGWSATMSQGSFVVQMLTWNRLFSTVATLILTVLVLGDLVFVLAKAGVEPDKKPLLRLLVIRDWSTPLGLAAIVLTVIGQLVAMTLGVFI